MRAFLSHSSKDKQLVEGVARRLGRAYVVYDKYAFEPGDDFNRAILEGLQRSDIFVLFASKASLESEWVKAELTEAQERSVAGAIRRIHVVLIDPTVAISDLPKWLESALIVRQNSPALIANQVQRGLTKLALEQQSSIFVGRSVERENAARLLAPASIEQPEPAVFLFHGLQGMGRRALCKRVADELFLLRSTVVVDLEDGDDTDTFWLKLWEELHPSPTQEAANERKARCEAAAPDDCHRGIIALLEEVASANQLAIAHDHNSLLDNDGFILERYTALFKALSQQTIARLALISTRRPQFDGGVEFPCIQVRELPPNDSQRLLVRLARDEKAQITTEQCIELAKYIRGFPPAAYYTVQQIKSYSAELLMTNKVPLVNFRVSIFMQFLLKDNRLDDVSKTILVLLSQFSSLPLAVIGTYCNISAVALDERMRYLADSSLAYPSKRYIQLSDPISEAVSRAFKHININYTRMFDALESYLGHANSDDSRLDLGRALHRAALMSGREAGNSAIALVSDFIGLTKEFYHNQDYKKAINTALPVLELRPNNVDLRSFLTRAYIQEEMFDDAIREIKIIREKGYLRDAFFLTGFMERHRNNYSAAIDAYLKSQENGRRGTALHREMAQCYLELGELEDAKRHIAIAHDGDPDNRYVVDLEIKIALMHRDETLARERLDDLRYVDTDAFYFHRGATVELAFGSPEKALELSAQAVREAGNPSFAMLSNHVNCLIHAGKYAEAGSALGALDAKFSKSHHDQRVGLRCKLLTRGGHYDDAISIWARLRDKEKSVHKALKIRALKGKLATMGLSLDEANELSRLGSVFDNAIIERLEMDVGGGVAA